MCSSADVEIVLNNQYQRRPFEHENYGDALCIKRHITKASSSYSLKVSNIKKYFLNFN